VHDAGLNDPVARGADAKLLEWRSRIREDVRIHQRRDVVAGEAYLGVLELDDKRILVIEYDRTAVKRLHLSAERSDAKRGVRHDVEVDIAHRHLGDGVSG
jgi:hypothetical protein